MHNKNYSNEKSYGESNAPMEMTMGLVDANSYLWWMFVIALP